MSTPNTERRLDRCDGCEEVLTVFDRAGNWRVCMDCTRARAKAVAKHSRCACGRRKRRPLPVRRIGSRSWVPCQRCLGTIRQLS